MMSEFHRAAFLFLSIQLLPFVFLATPEKIDAASVISNVSISRPFFNPVIGEKVKISFLLSASGIVDLTIVDRDGYPVRHLIGEKKLQEGAHSVEWSGLDDQDSVVPDEAYSLKIDLVDIDRRYSYFPANQASRKVDAVLNYYDRQSSTVVFTLSDAARVHGQAGCAKWNSKTKKGEGPVLKTLINRKPMAAGQVVFHWAGFDESGTIYVPDLPDFAIGIAATALPENSILISTNRETPFAQRALKRSGRSLFTFSSKNHRHHAGLSTLDDISPDMKVAPVNAEWKENKKVWVSDETTLKIRGSLEGPSAANFSRHSGKIYVFVNQKIVATILRPKTPFELSIPAPTTPGKHIIAINWANEYGPAAVNSFWLEVNENTRTKMSTLKN